MIPRWYCDAESSLANINFFAQRKLKHLKDIPSRELQRPSLEFLCKRGLETVLLTLQDYGIACFIDHKFVYNDLFKSKFINDTQVNFTKTVFDNGIETCYTNFNSDNDPHDMYYFISDFVHVTIIANEYGDSNSDMLERLLSVVKTYHNK